MLQLCKMQWAKRVGVTSMETKSGSNYAKNEWKAIFVEIVDSSTCTRTRSYFKKCVDLDWILLFDQEFPYNFFGAAK